MVPKRLPPRRQADGFDLLSCTGRMKGWQKRARRAVAIFGIASAVVVFFAIRGRDTATVAAPPRRIDPKAVLESSGAVLQQVRGTKQDFTIESKTQLAYEGGATRLIDVRISVKERQGRDFVISGREATAGENQKELRLTGNVKLASSDGFEVITDRATFSESDGIVRAPGPLSFKKGRMTGSGVGMTYDKNKDVLTIVDQSKVQLTREDGTTEMDFVSGTATLARQDNYLALQRNVHVLRGEQVIDTDNARATLTDDDEHITYTELRGNSRVVGGAGTLESMSARDIDLDYTDDGKLLERVLLSGAGTITLAGQNGAPGRQMMGESIEVKLAGDGTVTWAHGQTNVGLVLPGSDATPPRSIKAASFDASGESGNGLTDAHFSDEVEYREQLKADGTGRVARSGALQARLQGDALTGAIFTHQVTFEDQGLRASAAEARYQPEQGILLLSGADQGGGPHVADEQVTIDAESIDLTLEGRKMLAKGNLKTIMQPSSGPPKENARMPGLLKQEQPANVSAASLEYEGASGHAVYTGSAQLWQGDTAVRGDVITIDQQTGDLLASGSARSTISMDNGMSIGRADEIRYDDQTRQIMYRMKTRSASGTVALTEDSIPGGAAAKDGTNAPSIGSVPTASNAPAGAPTGTQSNAATPLLAQLSGPQGDVRGDRIVVVLAKTESRAERLEAYNNVSLQLETRHAVGSRLTYYAADERYVMSGVLGSAVTVVEQCRETTGKTLTFFKSTDRIIVDGNEEIRTQTRSGGRCQEPGSR
jgi:LPS export ABC transporter protein LptC